ncbi:MAG: AcvB/VirJ family lysyl-phosphatidylglycerol hydrolase [Gemmatimonadaceae bacterium]
MNPPRDLPIHEVLARTPGRSFAVLLTGDGGWVDADRELATELANRGVSVVALDTRAYLRAHKRSPSSAAADAERIIRYYEDVWKRDEIVLVGYSRGADMMPFIANRITQELRDRVALVALLGLSPRASFEFHWTDLIRETRRATDLPVVPELERLRGKRIVCVFGEDEKDSACRGVERALATPIERSGSHRIHDSDAADLARVIVEALAPVTSVH